MGREPRAKLRELLLGQRVDARRRHLELNLMASHGGEVELVPRDDLDRRPPREDTETETAQQRGRTDVHSHHANLAIPPGELDVRDPSQPPTAEVEDLRVEDVAREQELVGGKLVLDRILRDHDVLRERRDRGPGNPAVATAAAHAQRNHVRFRLAEVDDEVVDLPDPRPFISAHGTPELIREHEATLVCRSRRRS